MYIFNIIPQFRFYCPYLWIMRTDASACAQPFSARTNSVAVDLSTLQTNLSAIDSEDIDDGLHLKEQNVRGNAIHSLSAASISSSGEVNKWGSMRRCLSSSSWYKQSHQYPRCQWRMNGHCRKTSNHEQMIQLLLLKAVCPIIGCYWEGVYRVFVLL